MTVYRGTPPGRVNRTARVCFYAWCFIFLPVDWTRRKNAGGYYRTEGWRGRRGEGEGRVPRLAGEVGLITSPCCGIKNIYSSIRFFVDITEFVDYLCGDLCVYFMTYCRTSSPFARHCDEERLFLKERCHAVSFSFFLFVSFSSYVFHGVRVDFFYHYFHEF